MKSSRRNEFNEIKLNKMKKKLYEKKNNNN